MRLLLLLLFLAYPLIEIALMIKVGAAVGVLALLLVVLATAVLGVVALRRHGVTMLRRMGEDMAAGRPPVAAALDGALVGAAGLLLMAPGLITDVLGLVLLVPPLRGLLAARLASGFTIATADLSEGEAAPRPQPTDPRFDTGDAFARRRTPRTPVVIDGEFERLEERTVDPRRGKGAAPGKAANDP